MITYKKTFDYYATDGELDSYVHSILETLIGDLDDDVQVAVTEDDDHRYITLNIFDRGVH